MKRAQSDDTPRRRQQAVGADYVGAKTLESSPRSFRLVRNVWYRIGHEK